MTTLRAAAKVAASKFGLHRRNKHEAELSYWEGELERLRAWFEDGTADWWGIRPPSAEQKDTSSDDWRVNAVMTMHKLRPSYTEELRIERHHLRGLRVLEVGSGPLAPILQFVECRRYCLDPLANLYTTSGWPLYEYDAKFVCSRGEKMPFPDGYFDAAISVNALDHVDDFEAVAYEMQRVVKQGGRLFFEVEYHQPKVTEPVRLDDERIRSAFSGCELKTVVKRSGREMFQALVDRFDLVPNRFSRFGDEQFVTWHASRR